MMSRSCGAMRALFAVVAIAALMSSSPAFAKDTLTLGVFLPTTVADGQKRFEVSEQLGAALGASLGKKVVVKNFGRFEDFAAAASGSLDLVIVETWAAAQLKQTAEPISVGRVGEDSSTRWVIVTSARSSVKDLKGKRLAVPRGVKAMDAKFVTNLIFDGDLPSPTHFKVISVPNAESALAALESKSVEAALLPASSAPDKAHVVFRSGRIPAIVVLALRAADGVTSESLSKVGGAGPITAFVAPKGDELQDVRRLLTKGPPPRVPVLAEAPAVPPSTAALIDLDQVDFVLPAFADMVEAPTETPDD